MTERRERHSAEGLLGRDPHDFKLPTHRQQVRQLRGSPRKRKKAIIAFSVAAVQGLMFMFFAVWDLRALHLFRNM